jgi:hypothetical protein
MGARRNAASLGRMLGSGGPHHSGFVEGWRAALAAGTLVVGLAACCGPTEPQLPGGGPSLPLDYPFFVARVEPILGQRDCTRTNGCHGGQGAGMMLLSGGGDPEADFVAVRPLTRPWNPPSSPLLLKPLALGAGGVVHGGGDIFADTTDADYVTIRDWIAGAKLEPSVRVGNQH